MFPNVLTPSPLYHGVFRIPVSAMGSMTSLSSSSSPPPPPPSSASPPLTSTAGERDVNNPTVAVVNTSFYVENILRDRGTVTSSSYRNNGSSGTAAGGVHIARPVPCAASVVNHTVGIGAGGSGGGVSGGGGGSGVTNPVSGSLSGNGGPGGGGGSGHPRLHPHHEVTSTSPEGTSIDRLTSPHYAQCPVCPVSVSGGGGGVVVAAATGSCGDSHHHHHHHHNHHHHHHAHHLSLHHQQHPRSPRGIGVSAVVHHANNGTPPGDPLHKPYLKFGVHAILSSTDVRSHMNPVTSSPCKYSDHSCFLDARFRSESAEFPIGYLSIILGITF